MLTVFSFGQGHEMAGGGLGVFVATGEEELEPDRKIVAVTLGKLGRQGTQVFRGNTRCVLGRGRQGFSDPVFETPVFGDGLEIETVKDITGAAHEETDGGGKDPVGHRVPFTVNCW